MYGEGCVGDPNDVLLIRKRIDWKYSDIARKRFEVEIEELMKDALTQEFGSAMFGLL
jgi:hypothetical protein